MRLVYCYHCRTLSKVPDYLGPPLNDRLLQDWIDRHMHGMTQDEHPGGRVFPMTDPELENQTSATDDDAFERSAVEQVKTLLAQQQHEVFAYRDELKDDATVCFRKHRNPEFPGKPCIDYQASHKRLGRRDQPPSDLMYLCTYCPYESSVTVAKRSKRGDYN